MAAAAGAGMACARKRCRWEAGSDHHLFRPHRPLRRRLRPQPLELRPHARRSGPAAECPADRPCGEPGGAGPRDEAGGSVDARFWRSSFYRATRSHFQAVEWRSSPGPDYFVLAPEVARSNCGRAEGEPWNRHAGTEKTDECRLPVWDEGIYAVQNLASGSEGRTC